MAEEDVVVAEVLPGQHQEDALHHTFCSSTGVGGRNGVTVGHGEAGRSSCKLRQLGDAEEGPNGAIEVGKSSTSCSPAMLLSGAGVMLGTFPVRKPWRAAPAADAEERPWPRRAASQCKMTARRAGIATSKRTNVEHQVAVAARTDGHALRTITGTRDQQGTIRGPTRALAPDTRAPTVVEAASEPLPSDERARRETHPHTADTHHRSHVVSTTNPGDTRTPSTDTSRQRGRSRGQQGPSEDRRRAYA